MRFLSVGPRICLQLPSNSTSRWTPLLFSYTFPTTWACSGLSPARARPWRANETCATRRTRKVSIRTFPMLTLFFHNYKNYNKQTYPLVDRKQSSLRIIAKEVQYKLQSCVRDQTDEHNVTFHLSFPLIHK